MRLVLDTNVIVSAVFWGGIARQALENAQRDHVLCFSDATLSELEKVMRYSKFAERTQKLDFTVSEFVDRLTEHAIVIPTPAHGPDIIKTDPDDNKFLSCAIEARAECIVSGDKHLLDLKTFEMVDIITPQTFLSRAQEG